MQSSQSKVFSATFSLSLRMLFVVDRPVRSTFPAFPISSLEASDFRVLQNVTQESPTVCETPSFPQRPQNSAAANAHGIQNDRLRHAINRKITMTQTLNSVRVLLGEGTIIRGRKTGFSKSPWRRANGGSLAFAYLIHDIVPYRNLSDTLGFIQYSISSLSQITLAS